MESTYDLDAPSAPAREVLGRFPIPFTVVAS
jgi:hypothetical protein